MDEALKRRILWVVMVVALIFLVYSVTGTMRLSNHAAQESLAVDRSELKTFKLLGLHQSDVVTMDLLDMKTNKKYEKIFLSQECPEASTKKPGMIMRLSLVEHVKLQSQEKFYVFERAYDYLCTKKDMAAADEALLKAIKEARQRHLGDGQ